MFVDTRAIGFPLTDAILMHVDGRVESALGAAADRVLMVRARLDDVNGERHRGPDKRCRLTVALRGGRETVQVEAVDADLYAAIDEAARRARRVVLKSVHRHIGRQRRDPQRPGALVW